MLNLVSTTLFRFDASAFSSQLGNNNCFHTRKKKKTTTNDDNSFLFPAPIEAHYNEKKELNSCWSRRLCLNLIYYNFIFFLWIKEVFLLFYGWERERSWLNRSTEKNTECLKWNWLRFPSGERCRHRSQPVRSEINFQNVRTFHVLIFPTKMAANELCGLSPLSWKLYTAWIPPSTCHLLMNRLSLSLHSSEDLRALALCNFKLIGVNERKFLLKRNTTRRWQQRNWSLQTNHFGSFVHFTIERKLSDDMHSGCKESCWVVRKHIFCVFCLL